jgi:quinol-cytochrome oxidoreductase complex cytochrome b subunit
MLDVMGWALVAVGIPVFSPILVNVFFWAAPLQVVCPAQRRWYVPIKDGQLFWVVIALAASALYEMANASLARHGWMEALFIIAIVMSAVLGAVGALWPAESANESASWMRRYGLLLLSVILIAITGAAATFVHVNIPLCNCGVPHEPDRTS